MASAVRTYAQDRLAWSTIDLVTCGIDSFTLHVYLYLTARANGDGRTWPKQTTIATDIGIRERQVRRCIEKLVAERLVVVVEQSGSLGGRRSIYYLTRASEWLTKAVSEPATQSGSDDSNRPHSPVEPATQSGSLYKGTLYKELNTTVVPEAPKKATKGKKAPDPKSFLAMFFPDEFRHDDDFVAAWDGWGQNRIEAKNPLNERSAKIAANKLVKYPIKIAIEALERSTLSGWTGVFPESVGKGPNGGKYQAASDTQPKQDFGF